MQNIPGFASGIFSPDPFVVMIVHVRKINRRFGSVVRGTRGNPNDPNRILWGHFRRFNQEGMKKVGEKEMAEVVNSQLQFVTLRSLGTLRGNHHSGVVPENIQSRFAGEELLCR